MSSVEYNLYVCINVWHWAVKQFPVEYLQDCELVLSVSRLAYLMLGINYILNEHNVLTLLWNLNSIQVGIFLYFFFFSIESHWSLRLCIWKLRVNWEVGLIVMIHFVVGLCFGIKFFFSANLKFVLILLLSCCEGDN